MIIVSDTTPIRYLVEIEKVGILEELFGKVIIPEKVSEELQRPKTPQKVKDWMQNLPGWIEVAMRTQEGPKENRKMKKTISARTSTNWFWIQGTTFPSCLSIIALLLISCFLYSTQSNPASAQEKKITIEELITRHLESIGSAEARAKASTRVASGEVKFIVRLGGAANVDGQGMMVSSGAKLRFGIKLPLNDYTGEDMAFDGAKAATGLLPQGRRSPLSLFLNSQDLPLREGLIGGSLSTAWPLLRLDQAQPKLDYRGLKKVEGRQLHEVSYRPRKRAGDLKVSLFFDPETFRHARTRYSFEIGATIGSRENPNQNVESYYTLIEDFDDFRAVDGLTLPHKYRLQLSIQGGSAAAVVSAPSTAQGLGANPATSLHDWTFTVKKVEHNTKIDDPVFIIK